MLPIKSWRIYYADGSTFDSTMGTWADAPPFGVQCVVYYHVEPHKTIQTAGSDYSFYEYLGETEEKQDVKMGLWMDDEGFYRLLNLAEKSSKP